MSNSNEFVAASYPAATRTNMVAQARLLPDQLPREKLPPEQLALLFYDQTLPQQSPPDLRVTAAARLDALWTLAKPQLKRKRMIRPGLQFVRGKTYAGRAHYADRRIEINEDLLERHPEAMLHETIAHELAHLITQYVHGQKATAHGGEWQHIMRNWFSVEPERTHRFDMSGLAVRRQRRFSYRCSCQVHELTAVRHKRARRGTEYRCVNCTGPLQFVENASG